MVALPTNVHTYSCICGLENFKLCKNPSIEQQYTPSIVNGCGAKLLNALEGYALPEPISIILSPYLINTNCFAALVTAV